MIYPLRLGSFALGALLFATSFVFAETLATVRAPRITLGDVCPGVAPGVSSFDLGAAPPPGRSLFLSRDDLAERLRMGGISARSVSLPAEGVRVQTESRTYSPEELEALVSTPIQSALPRGVRLDRIRVRQALTLAAETRVGHVRLPKFVFREGAQTQSATVELLWGNQSLQRLVVEMTVELDRELLATSVERGTTVTLAIQRGPVEISALAETLSQARIGQSVQVRIGVTKKILTATLVGADRAEIVVK